MGNDEKRKKRRKRTPPTRPFTPTERDIDTVAAIAHYRFLRSDHITRLIPGSAQNLLWRLRKLFDAGYIDKIPFRLDPRVQVGTEKDVYMLDHGGMLLLEQRRGIPKGKIRWKVKNEGLSDRHHVKHTLLTAETMIHFELAHQSTHPIRLISTDEIISGANREQLHKHNPLSWRVNAPFDGIFEETTVTPDYFFGLEYTDLPKGKNKRYFFLEADRGTEPVRRKKRTQESLYRKMSGYMATRASGIHTALYNIKGFRVCFVTTGKKRIETLLTWLDTLTNGKGYRDFLFTDEKTLADCDDVLQLPWTTGTREVFKMGDV